MNVQMIDLAYINSLPDHSAEAAFIKCSGSRVWAAEMTSQRPFAAVDDLDRKVAYAWSKLTAQDWLDSFSSHAKIGDVENLRKKFATTATWASREQAGVDSASEETLRKLAEGNQRYEKTFGYIFIVCASGKTAAEMLSLLEKRLESQPEAEFTTACNEQKKITRLRLEKLQP